MAASLTFWRRLESLVSPVLVRKGATSFNPALELFYFRGRYMLAAATAVYSDGQEYRPLVKAFANPTIKDSLPAIKKVLVLGTGLASAVHILNKKGFFPDFTLVEIDGLILQWAKEFLPKETSSQVRAVNDDAFAFIKDDTGYYDLIVVDIFIDRNVPDQVTDASFIHACRQKLNAGGFLVMNYMERRNEQPGKAKATLEAAFTLVKEITFGINKVYIATA